MSHGTPEPVDLAGTDDEPHVQLPRALPRWMQRMTEIETAVQLTVVGVVLLVVVIGAVSWTISRVT